MSASFSSYACNTVEKKVESVVIEKPVVKKDGKKKHHKYTATKIPEKK